MAEDDKEASIQRLREALASYRNEKTGADECLGILGQLFHFGVNMSESVEDARKTVTRRLHLFQQKWDKKELPPDLLTALAIEDFFKAGKTSPDAGTFLSR